MGREEDLVERSGERLLLVGPGPAVAWKLVGGVTEEVGERTLASR